MSRNPWTLQQRRTIVSASYHRWNVKREQRRKTRKITTRCKYRSLRIRYSLESSFSWNKQTLASVFSTSSICLRGAVAVKRREDNNTNHVSYFEWCPSIDSSPWSELCMADADSCCWIYATSKVDIVQKDSPPLTQETFLMVGGECVILTKLKFRSNDLGLFSSSIGSIRSSLSETGLEQRELLSAAGPLWVIGSATGLSSLS